MGKNTLTYTQHSVAFPTLNLREPWHTDEVSLVGRSGEMKFVFMDFNGRSLFGKPRENRGVQVCCFTESVNLLTSLEVQQLLLWIKGMTPARRNALTPEKLIRRFETLGIQPSDYHLAGAES